jgi:uncharacterized iron-regulated membrane protein
VSAVPGSLFNKILFWAHLTCGVSAGLLILLMSVTGVLLTYERQMIDSAARGNLVAVAAGTPRLSADELAAKAREQVQGNERMNLVFENDAAAPVSVTAGRGAGALLNPYTGAAIEDASTGRREFFQVSKQLHRWLGASSNSKVASLIDISNLMFVFIIVSGIYLWMPAVWRWRTVKGLMFFKTKYINARVRDFNWHHAFAFWALIPLFLIAVSGVVMSYPWANKLVYAAYGEEAPQRGGGGGGGGGQAAGAPAAGGQQREGAGQRQGGDRGGDQRGSGNREIVAAVEAPRATLQQLLDASIAQESNWKRITLPAQSRGDHVDVQVELKSTERRAPRRTLELSTADASVISAPPVAANVQTPGQRARSWFRLVHTGEQYGVIGQTIAGLASLAACFIAYTGLALAWRRLIVPLFRRSA